MAHRSRNEGANGDGDEPSFEEENVHPNLRRQILQKSGASELARLRHTCEPNAAWEKEKKNNGNLYKNFQNAITGRGAEERTFKAVFKATKAYFQMVFAMQQVREHYDNAMKTLTLKTKTNNNATADTNVNI